MTGNVQGCKKLMILLPTSCNANLVLFLMFYFQQALLTQAVEAKSSENKRNTAFKAIKFLFVFAKGGKKENIPY